MPGGGIDLGAFLADLRLRVPEPVSRRGLRTIGDVRRTLDAVEARLVERARLDGATWSEIGEDLGISGAGVRRRHPGPDPAGRDRPPGVPGLSRQADGQ